MGNIDTKSPDKEPTDNEIAILKAIAAKHKLTDTEVKMVMTLQVAVMVMGFGRNDQTVRVMKALIDVIESPILSHEDERKLGRV